MLLRVCAFPVLQSPAGVVCLADPDRREQAAQAGDVTIVVNTSSEVCGFHKAGGLGLTSEETSRCVSILTARTRRGCKSSARILPCSPTCTTHCLVCAG